MARGAKVLAQRAELDPDPVLSLIKDPRTYWLSAIGALVAYLAI